MTTGDGRGADGDDGLRRAEALFAARELLREAGPPRPRSTAVALRDLVAHLTDPSFTLTEAQLAALAADPRLRADLARLERELALFAMPAAAAAAAGEEGLGERRFPGARVLLRPSRSRPRQMFVVITLDEPAPAPRLLLLRGPEGETRREPLPPSDGEGVIQMVKDLDDPEDARLVELLRDPRATGSFLGPGG